MVKRFSLVVSLLLLLNSCPNPNDTTQEYPLNYIKIKSDDKSENTLVTSNQINYTNVFSSLETPVIASNKNGDSVIVWTDNKNGTRDIFAKRIDNSGQPKGDIFQVNTTNNDEQYLPSVSINDNGEFVVVWTTKNQDGDGLGVYARRYDRNGNYQGNEFKVNTSTTGDQWIPKVAVNPNGGFMVVWQSFGQDGNAYAIVGQKFTNKGIVNGYEFIINNMPRGSQEFPDIAMDSQGNSVVVWTTNQNQLIGEQGNGKYRDVYAKKFSKDGNPIGAEFAVSTTLGEQYYPSVCMNGLNNILVAWNTKEATSNNHDIYARYINSDSTLSKPAFRVSMSNRPDPLSKPSIAMDSNNNSFIVWHSEIGNVLSSGLFGKKFDANGNETKSEYKINSSGTNILQSSISVDRNNNFNVIWRQY
ncbi:MAG: hypothetical protein U0354_13845 [Candidatus Sericytochromatia bacterium]